MTAQWPYSSVQARWDRAERAWQIWIDGRQARDTDGPKVQLASTVIVQYAKQSDSGYGDKFGGVTPKIHTVGSGRGLLLRDGRTWPIHWERAGLSEPTRWLDALGEPVALEPGQVWVLLVEKGNKVKVQR
jgi:hypothetical protein